MHTLIEGDCLEQLRAMPDSLFDATLCDPPYALTDMRDYRRASPSAAQRAKVKRGGFVGCKWDCEIPAAEVWRELSRVLKPGAYVLAFGGPRTFHRLACNMEDGGLLIRDCLCWLHSQGFPKSLNIAKAIDRSDGRSGAATPNSGGYKPGSSGAGPSSWRTANYAPTVYMPSTPEAARWNGYGSALKPAFEPVILAQKPLEGTYAANALKHGCGGLNIDGCRIAVAPGDYDHPGDLRQGSGGNVFNWKDCDTKYRQCPPNTKGRWPANVVLDEEAAAMLDAQRPAAGGGYGKRGGQRRLPFAMDGHGEIVGYGDRGGPSRFFYCPKASRAERERGLDALPKKFLATMGDGIGAREHHPDESKAWVGNAHPTVKALALCRWLATLILPPPRETPRRLIVPYAGSGSEMLAALAVGWEEVVGIEREAEYVEIARARLAAA